MTNISLNFTLRAIAVLVIMMVIAQYFSSNELHIKPFISANILFVLSIFGSNHIKRIAIASLALAVIIPAGIIQSYLEGRVTIEIVVINVLMFAYLAMVAIQTVRGHSGSNNS